MSKLSEAERSFLRLKKKHAGSAELRVEQVAFLKSQIEDEHGIIIYMNGESDFGQKVIYRRRGLLERAVGHYRQMVQHAETIAAFVFLKKVAGIIPVARVLWETDMGEKARKDYNGAKNFRGFKNTVAPYSSDAAVLPSSWGDPYSMGAGSLADLEKEVIKSEKLIQYNINGFSINNVIPHAKTIIRCLENPRFSFFYSPDAKEEMRHIQSRLDQGKAVGYIYSGGETIDRRHVEAFIITSDVIVKLGLYKTSIWEGVHDSSFYTLLTPRSSEGFQNGHAVLSPQADSKGCGTLALLYLESLLKGNASEFFSGGLCLPLRTDIAKDQFSENQYNWVMSRYIASRHELVYIWIPPADVLQYSQSGRFNQFIHDVVKASGEELAIVTGRGGIKYEFPSLERLVLVANKGVDVADFRDRWLKTYLKVKAKRDAFQVTSYFDPGGNEINKIKYDWLVRKKDHGCKTLSENRLLAFKARELHRKSEFALVDKKRETSLKQGTFSDKQIIVEEAVKAQKLLHEIKLKYESNLLLGGRLKRQVHLDFCLHMNQLIEGLHSGYSYDLELHVNELKSRNNGNDWAAVTVGRDSDMKRFFDLLEKNNFFKPTRSQGNTSSASAGSKP